MVYFTTSIKKSEVRHKKRKKMAKVNLNELRNLTESINVKKTKGKTFNQRIVDELTGENLGKKVERYDLINRIAYARGLDEGLKFDNLQDAEFIKKFKKLAVTCRNGVDTSLANGHTNSNFSYNENFKQWKLHKEDGYIWITKA
jgi:hypothetical protein